MAMSCSRSWTLFLMVCICRVTANSLNAINKLKTHAKASLKAGDLKQALGKYQEAERLSRSRGVHESLHGAELMRMVGRVHGLRKERRDLALLAFNEATAIHKKLASHSTPEGIQATLDEANMMAQNDDTEGALANFQSVLEMLEEQGLSNTTQYSSTLELIGNIHGQHLEFDAALAAYGEAKRVMEEMHLTQTAEAAELRQFIGNIYGQQFNLTEAAASYREAMEIYKQIGQYETMKGAIVMQYLGNTEGQQGHLDEAVTAYEEAKRIADLDSSDYGKGTSAIIRVFLANTKGQQHDFEAALAGYTAAKEIYEEMGQSETPEMAAAYMGLGNIQGQQKKFDDALQSFEEAQRIYEAAGLTDDFFGKQVAGQIDIVRKLAGKAPRL